jgi:hypothetical protein
VSRQPGALAPSTSTARTQPDSATSPPAFAAPTGTFTIKQLPPGYQPRGAYQQTDGPAAGAHIEYQVFVNYALKNQIAVSVQTGDVARSAVLNPAGQAFPYTKSARQVGSYDTYVSAQDMLSERILAWVIGPTELVTVSVPNTMSDDDLFVFADGIEVTK